MRCSGRAMIGHSRNVKDKIELKCKNCGCSFERLPSKAYKLFCSVLCAKDWQRRNPSLKGKIGFRHSGSFKKGKEHWNYKGHSPEVVVENKRDRELFRIHFSRRVFERDNYTCVWCCSKGGYLHAHHILEWKNHPGERFNIDNCVTVHRGKCHAERAKWDRFLRGGTL
jgi:hypothetical protein